MTKRLVVGITGASGVVYAQRAIQLLAGGDVEVHLTISESAGVVLWREQGIRVDLSPEGFRLSDLIGTDAPNVVYHYVKNVAAPIASGSFRTMGMMVVPASTGTCGALANGMATNLIHRAAEVCLKERRKLVLVPRETPLSTIHIENLLKLSQAGAVVLPAMPGFYHQPKTLADQVDFVVTKLFDQFDMDMGLIERWQG
ncbi:UbiX family flavin prenyltransferase [Candidatus Poribacteria bacterium]|nr:UbiX family flavin prenyltransferase [Candidatus Poribacteria bacterium]